MKILLTGGSGLLGQYLNRLLSGNNSLLTIYNNNPGNCTSFNSVKADINDHEKIKKIFDDYKPDLLIHTAAFTKPILPPGISTKHIYRTNVTSTQVLTELCRQSGTKIIYTSTDLVYAGYKGSMLSEDAKLVPLSLYAETKLMGEMKIKELSDNYLILRLALLYGFGLNHSKSHFDQMYENLKKNKPVKLFSDQYRTPVSLIDAAEIILKICNLDLKNEIINVGGTERVSRAELGELLCTVAGFDKSLIERISMKDIPGYAAVEDVSMNTDKLTSLGIKTKMIEENIRSIIREK